VTFTRQFIALLRMNLGGLTDRLGAVLAILMGVTCTVGVLVSMLAMGTGLHSQVLGDVHDDIVLVTSHGAGGFQGSIPREEANAVRDLPGIARSKDGEPLVGLAFAVPVEARRRVTGRRVFFELAGSTMTFMLMHPEEMHFTGGRMYRPGLHELIASNPCVRQFTGFELGARREVRGSDWTVVGHFDQGHNMQCVVVTDADTLMTTFGSNIYSHISVQLASPGDFDLFRKALESNPALHLEAKHQRDMLEENFKQFNALLRFAAYFVGSIVALGATLGAVNSLYSIVDARRRELATLRAIGFGGAAIVAALLCESVLLALPGALLGSGLAWLFFHRMAVSPFGYNFELEVTAGLAAIGIAWALAMGLIGGLLPALRAARVPVTTALRAT
jgi:putative ABC transport system permease protein